MSSPTPSVRLLTIVAAAVVVLGVSAGMGAKWLWLRHKAYSAPLVELPWSALVPTGSWRRSAAGRGSSGVRAVHARPVVADAPFMSRAAARSVAPAPVVDALDGRRVRIAGYVVPLETSGLAATTFLLVPFVGACLHVPPPPPNQIVLVRYDAGVAIKDVFAPVTVTGRLSTAGATTDLADAGYRLHAEAVTIRLALTTDGLAR